MKKYYTYLIGWKKTDKWYYGVRYSKESNPEELWITYFTSSEHVQKYREEHGEPDVIQIRQIFDDPNKARLFEHGILRKLDVTRNDKWLNKTTNKCFDPEIMRKHGKKLIGENNPFFGRQHTEEIKEKIRQKTKGIRRSPKTEFKKGQGIFKGRKHTEETKQVIRDKLKGRKMPKNHISNLIVSCPICEKEGKKLAMMRWHFDNCKDKK